MSVYAVLFVVTLAFAIARFVVPVEGTINPADFYKNFAHIWVGILIGVAGAISWIRLHGEWKDTKLNWWSLPIAITIVEVVAFFVRMK